MSETVVVGGIEAIKVCFFQCHVIVRPCLCIFPPTLTLFPQPLAVKAGPVYPSPGFRLAARVSPRNVFWIEMRLKQSIVGILFGLSSLGVDWSILGEKLSHSTTPDESPKFSSITYTLLQPKITFTRPLIDNHCTSTTQKQHDSTVLLSLENDPPTSRVHWRSLQQGAGQAGRPRPASQELDQA